MPKLNTLQKRFYLKNDWSVSSSLEVASLSWLDFVFIGSSVFS